MKPMPYAIIALGMATAVAGAEHWPQWRGPAGNGSTSVGRYPTRWTTNDVAWAFTLPGKGGSTPVVWQDRIYLTAPSEGQDAVLALDLQGHQQWLKKLGPESPPKHRTLGSSCNASPVTDGQGLFVFFRSGRLAALEFDGTVRWQINLTEKYGPEKLFWDQGSSPVVAGPGVILTRMHQGDSWIAGFDRATGQVRWQQQRNFTAPVENDNAYSTPVVFEHQGRQAVLVWGGDHLTAHDPSDGRLLWSCGGFNPQGTGYWPAISSPVVAGDFVVVPMGRDDRSGQSSLHGIRLGGTGDVTQTHRAWKRDDLGVFVPALTAYQGRVYVLRHRGGIVCIDPSSGKTVWSDSFPKAAAPFYASPVVANGLLVAAREDGTVFTARADGERFELLGENPMGERILATPVPVANRLFLRGDAHLFCVVAP
jgi:outer membrane protein assembly factor BamB